MPREGQNSAYDSVWRERPLPPVAKACSHYWIFGRNRYKTGTLEGKLNHFDLSKNYLFFLNIYSSYLL